MQECKVHQLLSRQLIRTCLLRFGSCCGVLRNYDRAVLHCSAHYQAKPLILLIISTEHLSSHQTSVVITFCSNIMLRGHTEDLVQIQAWRRGHVFILARDNIFFVQFLTIASSLAESCMVRPLMSSILGSPSEGACQKVLS